MDQDPAHGNRVKDVHAVADNCPETGVWSGFTAGIGTKVRPFKSLFDSVLCRSDDLAELQEAQASAAVAALGRWAAEEGFGRA